MTLYQEKIDEAHDQFSQLLQFIIRDYSPTAALEIIDQIASDKSVYQSYLEHYNLNN